MNSEYPYNLGKYRIDKELGGGAFGRVYRAVDTTLERVVAIKILDPILTRDVEWVRRFKREARIMALLDHPHIVPVFEIVDADGRLFIAMKFVDGPDLARYVSSNGPFSWQQTLTIVQQTADALMYAHERDVTHRDLKPANILLDARGAALTDFGLAAMVSDNSMSMTMSGSVVGTPFYLAPEVWEGKVGDQRSDVYALACIVCEMLTGRRLFDGESAPSVMLAHFKPPVFPESWSADVPQGVEAVLSVAVQRDPDSRYANAREFARALAVFDSDAVNALSRASGAVVVTQAAQHVPPLAQEPVAYPLASEDVLATQIEAPEVAQEAIDPVTPSDEVDASPNEAPNPIEASPQIQFHSVLLQHLLFGRSLIYLGSRSWRRFVYPVAFVIFILGFVFDALDFDANYMGGDFAGDGTVTRWVIPALVVYLLGLLDAYLVWHRGNRSSGAKRVSNRDKKSKVRGKIDLYFVAAFLYGLAFLPITNDYDSTIAWSYAAIPALLLAAIGVVKRRLNWNFSRTNILLAVLYAVAMIATVVLLSGYVGTPESYAYVSIYFAAVLIFLILGIVGNRVDKHRIANLQLVSDILPHTINVFWGLEILLLRIFQDSSSTVQIALLLAWGSAFIVSPTYIIRTVTARRHKVTSAAAKS